MIVPENEKLLKVYTLLQMIVYTTDDLIANKELVMEEKKFAKRFIELILRNHKGNIGQLWKIEGGEETSIQLFDVYESVVKNLCEMKIDRLPLFLELGEGLKNGTIEVIEK